MKKLIISIISIMLILASFAGISVSKAASVSARMSGSTVTEGNNATITITFSETVKTAGFKLTYDSSKLEYCYNSAGNNAQMSGAEGSKIVAYMANGSNGINSITFTFKTLGIGTANCTASRFDLSDKDNEPIDDVTSSVSTAVTISAKPSKEPDQNKPNSGNNQSGSQSGNQGTSQGSNQGGSSNGSTTNKPSNSSGSATNKPSNSNGSSTNKPSSNSNTNTNSSNKGNTTTVSSNKNDNGGTSNNENKNNENSNNVNENTVSKGENNNQTENNSENTNNITEQNNQDSNAKGKLSKEQILEYSIFIVIGIIILILLTVAIIKEIKQRKSQE